MTANRKTEIALFLLMLFCFCLVYKIQIGQLMLLLSDQQRELLSAITAAQHGDTLLGSLKYILLLSL